MQTTNQDDELRTSQVSHGRASSQHEQQQEAHHFPTDQPDMIQGYIIEQADGKEHVRKLPSTRIS